MIALCHCGKPLHYTDTGIQHQVERMIELSGGSEFVTVTLTGGLFAGRSWKVQRHYIALHGITGKSDLTALGFQEIT